MCKFTAHTQQTRLVINYNKQEEYAMSTIWAKFMPFNIDA